MSRIYLDDIINQTLPRCFCCANEVSNNANRGWRVACADDVGCGNVAPGGVGGRAVVYTKRMGDQLIDPLCSVSVGHVLVKEVFGPSAGEVEGYNPSLKRNGIES